MTQEIISFHTYYDSVAYANPIFTTEQGEKAQQSTFSITDRSLTYRFYPHFHPYMSDLVKLLIEGGISGLQAADTDYRQNSDGSLTTMPNSTRARLPGTTQAKRVSDGTPLTLLAGAPLTLNDGTVVSIPNNTAVTHLDGTPTVSPAAQITLPGSIPVSFSSGTQMTAGGSAFILPDGALVTLPNSTQAALSDGTLVSLPAATQVGLRSGVPLPTLYADFFKASYDPSNLVQQPYPVKDLDFTVGGAYSIYNWELFFHVPLLIAIHLSQNQQFKDAQKWFHYIFDPTDDSSGPTPERFWKVNPFQTTDVKSIERILLNLSTGADPQVQQDTANSIGVWKDNPFQPFVVGRYRPTSFMLKTVMAYLDNLIAWGDSLFQLDTIETINEATQLYVMAANILGPRPQKVPQKGSGGQQTYATLCRSLDSFSNSLRDIEVDIPFDRFPHPAPVKNESGANTLNSIGQALYFCIPRNDKLLAYWDTVADRLFKIHNSLNLQGVFRQLPLYDPPIDPALLSRAAAAGLDVSAIVNGLNQPLPLVRFQLLVAKATEITQEVKALGSALLSAMEKMDNEALVLLRAQHENIIMGLAEVVKYAQWQEAIKAREGLEQSLANAFQRYTFYQKQLGVQDSQISVPSLDALDENSLETFSFQSGEPKMALQPYTVNISQASASISNGEIKTISNHEKEELDKLFWARNSQVAATVMEGLASVLSLIPQDSLHIQPWGFGRTVTFGGQQLHAMFSSLAAVARIGSEEFSYEASQAAKMGTYGRRELDWINQSNLAAGEMNLIFKQLRAAQIREALAHKEYTNQQTQKQHAQAIEDFLKDKQTNQDFYAWQKREVKGLYNKAFQLAFEVAKKAELALQHELGDPNLSYLQFTYLDGTEGLLAGEKLHVDIKRMEMAYHDLNQREYELTKHVSLLQVAPMALLQLRTAGSCTVSLPEELFDLDGPGHYFRRIKSVAVSVPCVSGPYTNVNCTLMLLNSSIRTSSLLNSSIRTSSQLSDNSYPRSGPNDQRFSDYYGSIQSVVTSSGQSDSGLFEANLHDERYLPFELSGAISEWQVNLPADVRQFDYNTIADVILHIRYTAREGGDAVKRAAVTNLQTLMKSAQTIGSVRLFSLRHEFPTEWAKFRNIQGVSATQRAKLSLTLRAEFYPFWSQSQSLQPIVLKRVEVLAQTKSSVTLYQDQYDPNATEETRQKEKKDQLKWCEESKMQEGPLTVIPLPTYDGTLAFYLDNNTMEDVWLAVNWGN